MNNLIALAVVTANGALCMAVFGRHGSFHWHDGVPIALFTLAFVLSIRTIKRNRIAQYHDNALLAAVIVLSGLGISALIRLDVALAIRQSVWLLVGLASFVATVHLPVWTFVRRRHIPWAVLGATLLLLTAVYGVEQGGARSSLKLGIQFQPIEIVKLSLVFFIASYLARNASSTGKAPIHSSVFPAVTVKVWGPIVLVTGVFVTLLVVQKDLGGASILFGLSAAMLFAATGSRSVLTAAAGTITAGAFAAGLFFDHVRTRFLIWLDPWSYADGPGRQIIEALFALGAGGLFGRGWGRGLADRIPVVRTDFIFALITEELGLLGASAVLFLLAVICVRTLQPAFDRERDVVERLGSAGVSLLFAIQSGLIVAGVTRLIPVTGVTLPFVSYGGSSLIISYIQLGLAYNVLCRPVRLRRHTGVTPQWIEA